MNKDEFKDITFVLTAPPRDVVEWMIKNVMDGNKDYVDGIFRKALHVNVEEEQTYLLEKEMVGKGEFTEAKEILKKFMLQ